MMLMSRFCKFQKQNRDSLTRFWDKGGELMTFIVCVAEGQFSSVCYPVMLPGILSVLLS